MKSKFYIGLILLVLLVVSTNSALAFGNSKSDTKTEQSACKKQDNHHENKSCCSFENNRHDKGYGGSCANSSCHCPVSVTIPIIFNNADLSVYNNYNQLGLDWSYIQHNPKSVYLPIWEPPKISQSNCV